MMTDSDKSLMVSAHGVLEQVVVQGDLSKLTAGDRVSYYRQVCQSLGLNPLTQPFQYITLNGKLTLYARRDCTDQLRRVHRVNITITGRERHEDVYIVTARATMPDGRTDESIGAVAISALKGDALANALMKSETKAKRRATLSIVGLGWLDETETETIPEARRVEIDVATGEIARGAELAQPAAVVPAAKAPPPPKTGRRDRLLVRWEELWQEAAEAHVDVIALDANASEAEIEAAGKALAARIAAAHEAADKVPPVAF